MKATLNFDLPDEQTEWEITTQAQSVMSALYDTSSMFRSKLKYTELSASEYEVVSNLRDEFMNIIHEYNINLI